MLPNQVLSSIALSAPFLSPKTGVSKAALLDITAGPVAIADASLGNSYQTWGVSTDLSFDIVFTPYTTRAPVVVYTAAAKITWLAGTFDQGARPQAAFMLGNISYLWWYDTINDTYQLTALPANTLNPFISLDDARSRDSTTSDVIVSYTNSVTNHLYFRAQRDRYAIEYDLGFVGAGALMTQVGMNLKYRFQFEFQSLGAFGRHIYRPQTQVVIN